MNKEALIELAKTFGRFIWFGLLGLVAAFLTSLASNADLLSTTWTVPIAEVSLPIGVYIVAGIGFALKALDRYIHKNPDIELRGIAPTPLQ